MEASASSGGFDQISQVAGLMRGYPALWAVAGGWAASLHAGRPIRNHEDVEVAVFYKDQHSLWELIAGWQPVYVSKPSHERVPWSAGEVLKPPVHELHTTPPAVLAELEILLNESAGPDWVYRRDHRIRLPLDQAVLVDPQTNLPYLAPEIVLLYKAKHLRPQDHQDYRALAPLLTASRHGWLTQALQLTLPGHHGWLGSSSRAQPC